MKRPWDIYKHFGLIGLLCLLPWWALPLLAAAVYLLLAQLLPGLLVMHGPWQRLLQPVSQQAAIISLLLLLPLPFSLALWLRRRWLRQRLRDLSFIRAMHWRDFEQLIAAGYRARGFRVLENCKAGADGGIDLRLRHGDQHYLVQCKQWGSAKVGVKVVRELYGVLMAEGAQVAVVVTPGGFTAEAMAFADGKPIELLDGAGVLALLQSL